MTHYLPTGLPVPVPERDGLSEPYWSGLRAGVLRVQRCGGCDRLQWGPEWICHRCHGFDLGWEAVAPRGRIYSWQRAWHPVHPALAAAVPYLVVVVELPDADNIRMLGIRIGDAVDGVFEHHAEAPIPFSLLQWRIAEAGPA